MLSFVRQQFSDAFHNTTPGTRWVGWWYLRGCNDFGEMHYMYVQCALNISRSVYNSQSAPIVRPLVLGRGVFVSFKCDWGFALEAAVLCTMLSYILPRYIESLLYLSAWLRSYWSTRFWHNRVYNFGLISCVYRPRWAMLPSSDGRTVKFH